MTTRPPGTDADPHERARTGSASARLTRGLARAASKLLVVGAIAFGVLGAREIDRLAAAHLGFDPVFPEPAPPNWPALAVYVVAAGLCAWLSDRVRRLAIRTRP